MSGWEKLDRPNHPYPPTKCVRWANFHNFRPILMKLGMEVPFGGKNEPIVWLAPFSDLSHHPTNLLVNPSKANLDNATKNMKKLGNPNYPNHPTKHMQ